ncbi:hypothetical protein [Oryza sativa Japonica Group]|uniref:Uncharacterized protein n=1 Tax=Oryza sativa subsp. japonica TaxID=39947 RepID=Q5ZB84_ORYSJ|nr:hypothetical protein [Oryza sativa Japonica Group]
MTLACGLKPPRRIRAPVIHRHRYSPPPTLAKKGGGEEPPSLWLSPSDPASPRRQELLLPAAGDLTVATWGWEGIRRRRWSVARARRGGVEGRRRRPNPAPPPWGSAAGERPEVEAALRGGGASTLRGSGGGETEERERVERKRIR